MKVTGLLQGAVFCTVFLFVCSSESKVRRRKCHCRKYMEKINRDVNQRLKEFENRFDKYIVQNSYGRISSDLKIKINKTIAMDGKLEKLIANMSETKEALRHESYSLRVVQENLYSQEVTLDTLNTNFKTLEEIVKSLSNVVEHLEETMRTSMSGHSPEALMSTYMPGLQVPPKTYPKDCQEVYRTGGMRYIGDYYIVIKPHRATQPFKVLCNIHDGAGWTVIQRRLDGSVNFSRNWTEYKRGFGTLEGEFWLGNDNIHYLTKQGDTKLRIEMEDWDGKKYYAEYDRFGVSSEHDHYRLHVSGYHGTAGDSLTPHWQSHDQKPFSTFDKDNDNRFYDNCAEKYYGAWWFNDCFESHLNGKYYPYGRHNNYFVRNGIQWNSIHPHSSLKYVKMMIKPNDVVKMPNDI